MLFSGKISVYNNKNTPVLFKNIKFQVSTMKIYAVKTACFSLNCISKPTNKKNNLVFFCKSNLCI
jgi:hypothetical protein